MSQYAQEAVRPSRLNVLNEQLIASIQRLESAEERLRAFQIRLYGASTKDNPSTPGAVRPMPSGNLESLCSQLGSAIDRLFDALNTID